jgi:hypothetical protein
MSGSSDTNKDLTRKYFEEVLNNQHFALIPQLLNADYTFNGAPQPAAENEAWVRGLHADFPGLHFQIEAILGESNLVALRWRMDAPAAGGRPAGFTRGTNILTFAAGQAISNFQDGGRTSPLTGY